MEESYKITDVWKLKLRELEYQKKFMLMDPKFSEEDIEEMNKMIDYVKKCYAKALYDEKEVNKDEPSKSRSSSNNS